MNKEQMKSNEDRDCRFATHWEDRVPHLTNPWERFGAHLIWIILDLVADEQRRFANSREVDDDVKRIRSCRASLRASSKKSSATSDKGGVCSGSTDSAIDLEDAETKAADPPRVATNKLATKFCRAVDQVVEMKSKLDEQDENEEQTDENWLVQDWVITERPARWILDEHRKSEMTSVLSEASVGLFRDLDGTAEISVPLLEQMIDETRRLDGVCRLGAADQEDWIRRCQDFRERVRGPKSLPRLVESLEEWLHQAHCFARRAMTLSQHSGHKFRALRAEDIDKVEEEVRESYRRRSNAKDLQRSGVREVIAFIAEAEKHKVLNVHEVRNAINSRRKETHPSSLRPPANIGEVVVRKVCRELCVLKYAKNGNFRSD